MPAPLLQAQANWGAPANSVLAVDETFDGEQLPSDFAVNIGQWNVSDGKLVASEAEADNHAAAARYKVQTENAVYQVKFRLGEATKAFHVGFDPAKGELDKKGHLFSVVITPKGWRLMKHADKNRPKEDPNEVLAKSGESFQPGQSYQLRITTWEGYVTAMVEGVEPLKGSHPSFAVRKPTVVFRCAGTGLEIDDLKVWKQAD
ncbi:MAG: hypothetical protein AAF664_21385 [Planctomycetota bacterium]